MMSLEQVKLTLEENKFHLFKNYPIKSLAIFGSIARKEQNVKSDVDLLVEFSSKIGIRFIDLANELEKILGTKVDLVSKKGVKESYLKQIQSDLNYV